MLMAYNTDTQVIGLGCNPFGLDVPSPFSSGQCIKACMNVVVELENTINPNNQPNSRTDCLQQLHRTPQPLRMHAVPSYRSHRECEIT